MKQLLIVFCMVSLSYAIPPSSAQTQQRLTPNGNGNIHLNVELNPKIEIKSEAIAGNLTVAKEDPEDCSKYIGKELVERMSWVSHEKWLKNMACFSKHRRQMYLDSIRYQFGFLREHYNKMRKNRPTLEKEYGKEFVDHVVDTIHGYYLAEEKRIKAYTWFNSPIEKLLIAYEGVRYNSTIGDWEKY